MLGRSILVWLFLLHCLSALAWGKQGRHLAVEIARGVLSPEVVSLVDHYLGTGSWTEAADWMELSATPRTAASRAQWRVLLVARDNTYVPTKTPNLLNQIEYQLMVLEKRAIFPASSIAEAIKTLFALVPDAHQPLRCGYTEDKGGSTIQVSAGGKNVTLLQLWDDELLQLRKCDMWDCTKIIMKLDPKEKAAIENAPPLTWINESRALLPEVYKLEKNTITDPYLDRSGEIARQQMVKAGLRLAAILNRFFKG